MQSYFRWNLHSVSVTFEPFGRDLLITTQVIITLRWFTIINQGNTCLRCQSIPLCHCKVKRDCIVGILMGGFWPCPRAFYIAYSATGQKSQTILALTTMQRDCMGHQFNYDLPTERYNGNRWPCHERPHKRLSRPHCLPPCINDQIVLMISFWFIAHLLSIALQCTNSTYLSTVRGGGWERGRAGGGRIRAGARVRAGEGGS